MLSKGKVSIVPELDADLKRHFIKKARDLWGEGAAQLNKKSAKDWLDEGEKIFIKHPELFGQDSSSSYKYLQDELDTSLPLSEQTKLAAFSIFVVFQEFLSPVASNIKESYAIRKIKGSKSIGSRTQTLGLLPVRLTPS